ncbi:ribosomal protein L3 [Colletotrichum asianum]
MNATTLPRALARNLYRRAFRPISQTNNAIRARSHPSRPVTRSFVTTGHHLKMSDADYAAFLDKANQDPNEGYAKPAATKKGEFKAQDEGAEVPKAIQDVLKEDKVYVSDADEPFVGVALAWDEGGKGLPDEVEFAQLIQHPDPENADVELQDPVDWDANGDYKDIIEAVRKAGKGNDVRVYVVPKGGVRTEYWLVTTEGKGKGAKLVGVKALSVES